MKKSHILDPKLDADKWHYRTPCKSSFMPGPPKQCQVFPNISEFWIPHSEARNSNIQKFKDWTIEISFFYSKSVKSSLNFPCFQFASFPWKCKIFQTDGTLLKFSIGSGFYHNHCKSHLWASQKQKKHIIEGYFIELFTRLGFRSFACDLTGTGRFTSFSVLLFVEGAFFPAVSFPVLGTFFLIASNFFSFIFFLRDRSVPRLVFSCFRLSTAGFRCFAFA